MQIFLQLAKNAQTGGELRHSVVRALSFRKGRVRNHKNTSGGYSTKVIGNRLGKASAFEFHWKWGSETQIRRLQLLNICKSSRARAFKGTVPFSMNLCFRSSSELQGDVDPTWQIAAFEEDASQNKPLSLSLFFFFLSLRREGLPEVGDLQRSSEVFDPSLESQSAVGAAEIVSKNTAEAVFLSNFTKAISYSTPGAINKGSPSRTKGRRATVTLLYKSSTGFHKSTTICWHTVFVLFKHKSLSWKIHNQILLKRPRV